MMLSAVAVSLLCVGAAPSFPQEFLGDWQGSMRWSQTGKSDAQTVPMRLLIAKAPGNDTYTYRMTYGKDLKDVRPYTLKAVDKEAGHWQLDEGNGIVLDEFVVDGVLTSVFTVGGSTLVSRVFRQGRDLVSEIVTYQSKEFAQTGATKPGIPQVSTFKVISIQRALLKKK